MKRKAPVKIGHVLICIAAVLFCLVIISTAMMSGLYARYTSRNSGEDSARVAKFTVGADLDTNDVTANLSQNVNDGTFKLTAENLSEVSVRYDVTVTANLPAGVTLTIDGNAPSSSADGTYTFSNVGEFPANMGTEDHIIKFTADTMSLTSSATGDTYTKTIDFNVTVKFVQID